MVVVTGEDVIVVVATGGGRLRWVGDTAVTGGAEEVGTTTGCTGVSACGGHPNLTTSVPINITNSSAPETTKPVRPVRESEPDGSSGTEPSGASGLGSAPEPPVGGGGGDDNGSESTVRPPPPENPWPAPPPARMVPTELPTPGTAVFARGAP